ncbi:hypothetical protein [uncultured Ruminococcus sp.]|uniref:hypothetical protein n=1 Tax=uncultured Ruminococcus sp. TaxID=165186 RepID=UPI0025F2F2F6|nr:hypothetical protein [uncultured Ruminococcus sp.]
MKLNYRDRIVLTAVIVILVWVAGVMLFIKPGIERMQDSQAALDDAKATRSDLQDRVDEDKDLPERIQTAYKEVTKLTESFYSVQQTQLATQTVDDLLDSDEIKNLDMKISDYSIYQINPYDYMSTRPLSSLDEEVQAYLSEGKAPITADTADAEAGAKGEAVPAPVMIGNYQISFSYEGKIDDVQAFCDKLQSSNTEKTMLLNQFDYKFAEIKDAEGKVVTKEGKDGKQEKQVSDEDIKGTMVLNMLVVEKLPDPDKLG